MPGARPGGDSGLPVGPGQHGPNTTEERHVIRVRLSEPLPLADCPSSGKGQCEASTCAARLPRSPQPHLPLPSWLQGHRTNSQVHLRGHRAAPLGHRGAVLGDRSLGLESCSSDSLDAFPFWASVSPPLNRGVGLNDLQTPIPRSGASHPFPREGDSGSQFWADTTVLLSIWIKGTVTGWTVYSDVRAGSSTRGRQTVGPEPVP